MSEPFLHLGEVGAGIYGNRGRCGAGDMGSMSWEASRAGAECLFYGIRDPGTGFYYTDFGPQIKRREVVIEGRFWFPRPNAMPKVAEQRLTIWTQDKIERCIRSSIYSWPGMLELAADRDRACE